VTLNLAETLAVKTQTMSILYGANLFLIISMHMINMELIAGQVRGFSGVFYKLWPSLMLWLATSRY